MTTDRDQTAPLALAACVLFWGWQAGQLPLAMVMAALLEAYRFLSWRWQLTERDFQRIADISSVLFVALVVIQFNQDLIGGIFQVLKWLPCVLMPLLAAQLYGDATGVPLSALFASVRRRRSIYDTPAGVVDLRPHFAICCLIAASVGAERSSSFGLIAMALLGWLLFGARARALRGRALGLVVASMLAATGIGLGLQAGMYATQAWVEETALRWMQDPMFTSASPDRAFTAIGMIGRLKFSDRIRLRVATDRPLSEPLLLHEASYSEYRYASWRNSESTLNAIDPLPDGRTWRLQPPATPVHRVTLTVPMRNDSEVVPMPPSPQTLRSTEVIGLQRNRFGTIVADARTGFVRYEVDYTGRSPILEPPTEADLFVPESNRNALRRVASEMTLAPAANQQATVAAVRAFFADHFHYSLVQRGRSSFTQPINAFLLENRSGHCEYFATAAVLLLRHLGIPARYAVGYAVSEYSWLDRQYVARQRDAHAWVMAFVDGRWQAVDTTPSSWRSAEDQRASTFAPLTDALGWVAYQWSRWQTDGAGVRALLPWLLPPLVAWLLWRLRGTRRLRPGAAEPLTRHCPRHGMDSEFLACVEALKERGQLPMQGEPLSAWITRRVEELPEPRQLLRLLGLHYRYRFDPRGLSASERNDLRDGSLRLARRLQSERARNTV